MDFTFDLLNTIIKSLNDWPEVKIDTVANPYEGPRKKFKLTLQQHVKGRAKIHLAKLRRFMQRLNELNVAVNLQGSQTK